MPSVVGFPSPSLVISFLRSNFLTTSQAEVLHVGGQEWHSAKHLGQLCRTKDPKPSPCTLRTGRRHQHIGERRSGHIPICQQPSLWSWGTRSDQAAGTRQASWHRCQLAETQGVECTARQHESSHLSQTGSAYHQTQSCREAERRMLFWSEKGTLCEAMVWSCGDLAWLVQWTRGHEDGLKVSVSHKLASRTQIQTAGDGLRDARCLCVCNHVGELSKHIPRLFPKQGNLLQSQLRTRKTVLDIQ